MSSAQQKRDGADMPLAGLARDGWSTDKEATATCFCGKVQIVFPLEKPGLVGTFVCHCTDCRKITASMFASNFTVRSDSVRYTRGEDQLRKFGQAETIESGKKMTNSFCGNCGTLMYREGERFPGSLIMRIGTVDDFKLHETKLKPEVEQYTKDRVAWLHAADSIEQDRASHF